MNAMNEPTHSLHYLIIMLYKLNESNWKIIKLEQADSLKFIFVWSKVKYFLKATITTNYKAMQINHNYKFPN